MNPLRMLGRLLRGRTSPRRPPLARPLRARWDAAQSGPEDRHHWAAADDLSASAAATPDVRRVLRRRARYERDNDPHLNGLVKTLASDLVGTGPRLQLLLGPEHYAAGRQVEQSFAAWCRACDYAEKLRVLHEARPVDGEGFGLFVTNLALPHPVKLDLRLLESEQVETPYANRAAADWSDGVEYDAAGNPAFYHVLRHHPGDAWSWSAEFDRVPARNVVHWFRPSRPGQGRGVSEFASSLPIGAQTRRYAAAVLTAAEFAAKLAGVMTTNGMTPSDEDGPGVESMDEVDIPRGALLTLPEGWDAKQFDAKQPTGTYREFVTEKRAEMGRPVGAGRNLVTGDSSDFNFASGRLDHLPYQRLVWIERDRLRGRVLDRVFLAWLREASAVGLVPETLPPVNEWTWDWHWDGFASLDPVKETNATETRLRLGLTTLSEEAASEGKNWREVIDQQAAEVEYAASRGIDLRQRWGLAPAPATSPAPTPEPEDADADPN